jgi:hypothetical protein
MEKIVYLIWPVLILFISSIALVVLYWVGVIKSEHNKRNPNNPINPDVKDRKTNYITPRDFSVGLTPRDDYRSANLCNHKVLYPLNMLDVKYGIPPIPENCPCLQFIRPP